MRHTIPFAIILYATSAIIDAYLGITTLNPYPSYSFRAASATAIIATAVSLLNKDKPLRSLPFILASLILSIIALILGRMSSAAVTNVAIKAAAVILTTRPEIIKIELTTENEKESSSLDYFPSEFHDILLGQDRN